VSAEAAEKVRVLDAGPGRLLVESRTTRGLFYEVSNVGTPFVVCSCPAADNERGCWHETVALERSMELMDEQRTEGEGAPPTALMLAERSPAVVKSAEMQLSVVHHLAGWNTYLELGKGMLASGLLPASITKPEAAAVILMKGASLGIDPALAFEYIDVIDGRPAVRAQMIRALVAASGKGRIDIEETSSMRAVAVGHRPGWKPVRVVYTIEDASRAGLINKPNWKQHPDAMLVARASARVGRYMFADVLAGFPSVDGGEIVDAPDVSAGGTVTFIEGEFSEVGEEAPPTANSQQPTAPAGDSGVEVPFDLEAFNRLRQEFGVEDNRWVGAVLTKAVTPGNVLEWLAKEEGRTVEKLVSLAADRKAAVESK
jgi:hypothetical protein